jgi:adenylate cyclase
LIELDTIAVKGKTEPVKIYTSLGTQYVLEYSMNYEMPRQQHDKFLVFYRNQKWLLARRWINDLRDQFGGAMVHYYNMMEDRINQLEKEDLPEDWDGVYRATTK